MKSIKRNALIVLAAACLCVCVGLIYTLSLRWTPNLAQATCQADDLGGRHLPDSRNRLLLPHLKKTGVESYTVSLVDRQYSYTVLNCDIIRYADATTAQRAFAQVCAGPQTQSLIVGNEACTFATAAPSNLAFRRNEFLVVMNGDIDLTSFPAPAVDARLQMKADSAAWCGFGNERLCHSWRYYWGRFTAFI